MKSIYKFMDLGNELLILKVAVGGCDCLALIDTGAESCVIDEDFAIGKVRLNKPVNIRIMGVYGSDTATKAFEEVFEFKDRMGIVSHIPVKGHATYLPDLCQYYKERCDIPFAMILGSNWLRENRAIINYEDRTIAI
jgi:hypothetical protein